jgi:bifunctional non-homologous end joining protein LigD
MSLRLRTLPAGFIEPCLPTSAKRPPSGDGWLHEIKHDCFRCMARKDGKRVRLYSRPGNLTMRFPRIVEAVAAAGADLHHRRGKQSRAGRMALPALI